MTQLALIATGKTENANLIVNNAGGGSGWGAKALCSHYVVGPLPGRYCSPPHRHAFRTLVS
jgi:hypothetical protein